MSAYDELVGRCLIEFRIRPSSDIISGIENILAEVLRTLGTVTPEMANDVGLQPIAARAVWLAMLHASPLEPPK